MKKTVRRITKLATCLALGGVALAVWPHVGHKAANPETNLMATNVDSQPNPRALLRAPELPPLRDGEIREPSVGADMMPPSAAQAQAATISSADAVAAAKAVVPVPGMASSKSTSRLMMYTNVFGAKGPDGTMSPSVPTTLSWIVTFSDSTAVVAPPATFQGKLPDLSCQYVAVISAGTGKQLDAYQVCKPSS